eukprot:7720006-Alexandrium_andersonii.AAC.1
MCWSAALPRPTGEAMRGSYRTRASPALECALTCRPQASPAPDALARSLRAVTESQSPHVCPTRESELQ